MSISHWIWVRNHWKHVPVFGFFQRIYKKERIEKWDITKQDMNLDLQSHNQIYALVSFQSYAKHAYRQFVVQTHSFIALTFQKTLHTFTTRSILLWCNACAGFQSATSHCNNIFVYVASANVKFNVIRKEKAIIR